MLPTPDCHKRSEKAATLYNKLNTSEITNESLKEATRAYLEISPKKQEKKREDTQHFLAILTKLKSLLFSPSFLFNPVFLSLSGYIAYNNISVMAEAYARIISNPSRENFQQARQDIDNRFSEPQFIASASYLVTGLSFWANRTSSQNTNNPSTEPTPSTPRLNPS